MDWDKLRTFHAVAEAGSFTRAGESLHLSQSAVSRQISALEESLNAPLFQRHARGLKLTEQGRLLLGTVTDIQARLASTRSLLSESAGQPVGPLRITTTVGLGSTWLTPRIREFLDIYPDIAITLVVDDRELDLALGEADVAIRMSTPQQPDLIRRRLMTVHFHVYASKDYLEKHGAPKTPAELAAHRLVAYAEPMPRSFRDINWLLCVAPGPGQGGRLDPVFWVNSVYGIFRAVRSGLGIATLPDYLAGSDQDLVRILPELEGPSLESYFVYPEALRKSTRVAVFRDFLLNQISATPF